MIILPDTPGPVSLAWSHIDYGGQLVPPLGGETQRVNRLGNRLAVTVQLPPMKPVDAGAWVFALQQGLMDAVRWSIRQVEFDTAGFGSVQVDGAGQSGTSLAIKNVTGGKAFATGQAISIDTGGGHYVHFVKGPGGGGSTQTLTLVPPLRVSPANNASVNIAPAKIEGLLGGDDLSWTIDRARRVGLSFTITEQR